MNLISEGKNSWAQEWIQGGQRIIWKCNIFKSIPYKKFTTPGKWIVEQKSLVGQLSWMYFAMIVDVVYCIKVIIHSVIQDIRPLVKVKSL